MLSRRDWLLAAGSAPLADLAQSPASKRVRITGIEVLSVPVNQRGNWVFDQPFFVILNLAVGGNFDHDPQSDAIFPATMLVDWVRVYTKQ